MKYLLIAGSRTFNDRELFYEVMRKVIGNETEITIVEGGAAGADSLAREFALRNGLQLMEFKPDWKKFGRAAGPKRNDAMTAFIKEKNGAALYFWDEESKGTKQCIKSARKNGIGVKVWSTKRNRFLEEKTAKEEEKVEAEGKWIIFNEDNLALLFAECSECGYENNDEYLIATMINDNRVNIEECPKCKAKMTSFAFAEEVGNER